MVRSRLLVSIPWLSRAVPGHGIPTKVLGYPSVNCTFPQFANTNCNLQSEPLDWHQQLHLSNFSLLPSVIIGIADAVSRYFLEHNARFFVTLPVEIDD